MAFTKQATNTTNFTKQARPIRGAAGRFGFGTFGAARFGMTDSFSKQARPTQNFSKVARPT